MAYVPPHLRNKPSQQSKQPQRRQQAPQVVAPPKLPVEDNFPVLGNGTQRSSWIGRKFAELATEWNEDDEKRKEEEAEIIKSQRHDYTVVLPRFQNIRKFEEPEDKEAEISPSSMNETVDGWKTIERKKQQKPKELKEKTFEDYEKEEEKKEKEDETVWDVPEHETCWDERY